MKTKNMALIWDGMAVCHPAMQGVPERGRRSGSRSVNRNVTVRGERTSIRLEPEFWDALEEVCRREEIATGELVLRAEEDYGGGTRTGAVRVYLLTYFRNRERALRARLGGAASR